MSPRSRRSADELMAELNRKPEFVRRQQQRMVEREENRRRYADAAGGLLHDLALAGFVVSTMADLRKRGVGKRGAVPVLAAWLPRITYLPLKRDVIATLGSPWARPQAARPLLDEFQRIDPLTDPPDGLRWSIGDALERVADESVLEDTIAIARDRMQGRARALVVAALGNMGKARQRVVPLLLELLSDADVAPYAVMGLGKLKAAEARAAIEPFCEHPEAWIRKEAKKALARLDR